MLPKDLDPARFPRQGTRFTELGHEHGHALAKTQGDPTPKPIPGGLTLCGVTFHVFPFAIDQEPSTITDFNGFVGVCDLQGTGTATDRDGTTETLLFDTDMRFMKGTYVGTDGHVRHGTFGFV
jgi:hypothetical protein